jgi:hypothetical protein
MKKMVEQFWNSYAHKLVPAQPGTTQYDETRKAFYGGAAVIMGACKAIGESETSEEAGVFLMQSIEQELNDFQAEMRREQAPKPKTPVNRVDPEYRERERNAHKDKLRCESTGYDDESCLAVLNRYGMSREVAVALFRMMQPDMPNQIALALTILAHKAALEAIRAGVRE